MPITKTYEIPSGATTYSINGSGQIWRLNSASSLNSNSIGIFEWSDYHDNTILINGAITAAGASSGIDTFGAQCAVVVGATGTIDGYNGIRSFGENFSLLNNGYITGADYGVRMVGGSGKLVNNLLITGLVGVSVDTIAGEATRIVNHGTITANGNWAFGSGDGNETLINRGYLNGNVTLWDGDDVFDNRGGHFESFYIEGNAGNDTFIVDSKVDILENPGEGTDVIKSTISMNIGTGILADEEIENLVLLGGKNLNGTGNDLDNVIRGNSCKNHLSGGLGEDSLTGGKGADIFVFKTGFQHDGVTDFGRDADRIDLSDLKAATTFANLMAHHISKSGDNIVIHYGADHLTLEHTAKSDLQASDFIF